ncbi:GlsB/YeaQ/YmgE family stress response membrane protein [Croceibacterium aestuarii]|uniref:GlsB/YeaQ/YmgE family stress response membrane protein n=1 Tax=Croceibacterium aestuarii TaxID=3064139 RepID=UPI00272E6C90|nr:GlsB/YeaQ/YmgE family stress response membrane protein [Croceibacterium sp. D39]
MGWIIAIIVGGVAGWLASIVMRRDASMGIFMNIIVGIIGALLGNLLAGWIFNVEGTIQTFNLTGFIIAIVGAIVLLGIVNLFQRGSVR